MKLQKIAVIGGGIGGLASAIFLSRLNYEVTVFEKARKAGPVGAGFLLQPPGQMVLSELGVLNEIIECAVPINRLRSETVAGYKILDLHYGDLKGQARHGLGIQRSTIYDALYSTALEIESIEFSWDSCVQKIEVNDTSVSVYVNDELQTYDLCILTSGANSDLADEHFDGRIKNPYQWGCMWTTINLPHDFSPDTLHQRCYRAERMMGILPVLKVGDGYEAALYWSAKVSDMMHRDIENHSAYVKEMIEFWPETASSLETVSYPNFISAAYKDVWTPKPFKGRLVAIGDIAHGTSPQLGQGCTMALLDSWFLASFLANDNNQLENALDEWWKTRKYQLSYIRHLSRFLTPLYQSDISCFAMFRDFIMAPAGHLSWVYNLELKTLASELLLKKGI